MNNVKNFLGYAIRIVGVILILLGEIQTLIILGPRDPLIEIQSYGFPTVESWIWDVIIRGLSLVLVGIVLYALSSRLLARPILSFPKSFAGLGKEVLKGIFYAILVIGSIPLCYLLLVAYFSII